MRKKESIWKRAILFASLLFVNLLDIVTDESDLFIIVSAMGKTTNALEGVFSAMQIFGVFPGRGFHV